MSISCSLDTKSLRNHRVLHGTQKLCIVIMCSFRFNFFEKRENEQTNKYLTFCWFNSERDKKRRFYCGTEDRIKFNPIIIGCFMQRVKENQ